MHIIKLNATDSTNSYIRRLSTNQDLEDYTVVTADFQSNGRGQMGTTWQSQSHKNLTVSIYKQVEFLDVEQQFFISMAVSLAVLKVLETYQLKQVKVKWPNDILSEHKKIAGILIENIIKNNSIKANLIGIGLHLNQTDFEDVPNANSFKGVLGHHIDRDEVLHHLLQQLKFYMDMLKFRQFEKIRNLYLDSLFRINRPSMFKNDSGEMFAGYIKGVTTSGLLQVLIEDNIIQEYDMKQLSLMY